jgi:two-component system, chemotaxis family, chemotaxis protein CheY
MTETPITILLIEDQKFSADLFRSAFPKHPIFIAPNGASGVRMYHECRPDIVFLDLGLPDMPGFDVLQTLMDTDPGAYIVILSAMDYPIYMEKCQRMGAKGFVAKPYSKEEIQQYLDAAISKAT